MDTDLMKVDPFQEMERADEQMILDEIKGRAIDTLVYEVRGATGLSLAGVRETARVMNKQGQGRIRISDKEPSVIETDEYFEVRVYAVDDMNGGGNWGIKRQAKQYGDGKTNDFAYEQALAKAQRNAIRGLVPEWFVKQMIETWRTGKRDGFKTINQPPQQQTQQRNGKHWMLVDETRNTFMAAAERLGMETHEVLEALKVKKSTDYTGSFEDAIKSLNDWRTAHSAPVTDPNLPAMNLKAGGVTAKQTATA